MDVAIHFNDQRRLVTVEVNDEACDDLLPPEMDSQLVAAQFLPEDFLSRCHVTAQFFCALKFFFGDGLTWDDACPERSRRFFDWHDWNFTARKPLSRLPQGGEADPLQSLRALRVLCG